VVLRCLCPHPAQPVVRFRPVYRRYCCQYGGGSYYQVRVGGTVLRTGGQFSFTDYFYFSNALAWSFGAVPWGTRYVTMGGRGGG
jgi:hypothetical protein